MYVVPEDLREDVEHYCDKIERERRKKNGAVLYRYSRRKINKQIVVISKITLVLLIGFAMLAALCNLSDKEETANVNPPYYQQVDNRQNNDTYHPQGVVSNSNQPIAYHDEYAESQIYRSNGQTQTYRYYQLAPGGQTYQQNRSFTYINR